jgi:hypothetical protein
MMNGEMMKGIVLAVHHLTIHHFPLKNYAGVAQLVEHQPSKLRVAGSSLVSRSKTGWLASLNGSLGKKQSLF